MNKTIREVHRALPGEKRWRVTVVDTKTDRVLYDQLSHAGVLSSAEQVEAGENITLEGRTQQFYWGHPIKWLFCIDQIRIQFLRDRKKILADILPELKKLGLSEAEEGKIRSMFEDFAHHIQ